MPIRVVVIPALIAAVLAAGCGSSSNSSSNGGSSSAGGGSARSSGGKPSSGGSSMASGERETIETARDSHLGTYLVDEDRKALYLFEKDSGPKSTCYGECAKVWPPVTTSGKPKAEGKAKASKLSTIERRDGKTQVAYAGHPLYYYAPDRPGTAKGQGLDQFGAEWYVLAPSGEKVEEGES